MLLLCVFVITTFIRRVTNGYHIFWGKVSPCGRHLYGGFPSKSILNCMQLLPMRLLLGGVKCLANIDLLSVGTPHDQGTDAAKTDYYTNASGYHVPGVHTHLSDLLYCQWVYVPGVHTHKLPGGSRARRAHPPQN